MSQTRTETAAPLSADPKPSEATVLVIDDDDSMLRSLARALSGAGYAVESFTSPSEFLSRPPNDRPGCIVLDLRLPEMSGIELQKTLAGAQAPLPIVFISGHGDVPSAVQAMKAGAVDFLSKPFPTSTLLEAVDRAVNRDRAARAARADRQEARDRYALLSAQEERVCRLVVQGLLNKQIAAELGIAEQTVRVYRGRAMEKLGVDGVADLTRFLARVHPPT